MAVVDQLPEIEQTFNDRRSETPSIFVYHGTGYDCIYSLIRNGLRNLSNSKMMTAGAAYGPGIYVSP